MGLKLCCITVERLNISNYCLSDHTQQTLGEQHKMPIDSSIGQEPVTNMELKDVHLPNAESLTLLGNLTKHHYHWQKNAKVIDLRSDSVTKPTIAMKAAMMVAELGDDSYREDPTVNGLERHVAQLLGKEAALFVVSNRMSNVLASNLSRLYNAQITLLKNLPDGTMDLQDLENHIKKRDLQEGDDHPKQRVHYECPEQQEHHEYPEQKEQHQRRPHRIPITKMVTIENTHCYCGGKVLPLSWIDELSWITRKYDLVLHMDGSRLFHASEHLFVPTAKIVKCCDSVTICFSSLGAPFGAALAGSESFIIIARHYRKILGGGMHQAGIIAACAREALLKNVRNLNTDHEHAKFIASAIQNLKLSTFTVSADGPQTNIVHIYIDQNKTVTSKDLVDRLSKVTQSENCRTDDGKFITVLGVAKPNLKILHLVLHYDVNDNDVKLAVTKIVHVLQEFEKNISVLGHQG